MTATEVWNDTERDMKKPLVVLRQDFINDAIALMNQYVKDDLPMFAVADILDGLLKESKVKAEEQYRLAKDLYEKAVSDNEGGENEE